MFLRQKIVHRLKGSVAALGLVWLAASSFANAADFDTSALPRPAGAKQIYASPATTIYASPLGVADTAAALSAALVAAGWKPYVLANRASAPPSETLQILDFKKGSAIVDALITRPDGSTTASVNYTAPPLRHDLPFPAAGKDFAFDPNDPFLSCVAPDSVQAAMASTTADLSAMGWSAPPDVPKVGDDKAARAYFVRAGERPLLLTATLAGDGTTRIELKGVSEAMLAAANPARQLQAEAPVIKPSPAIVSDQSDVAKQMQQTADQFIADALKDALAPNAPAPAPSGPAEPLAAMEGAQTPIPAPANAENVEYRGDEGSLSFETPASVVSVAQFYRETMKAQGWKSEPSVINKPTMVELDFAKGDKKLSMTIMRMGAKTDVDAHGDGLVNAQAEAAAAAAATPKASADDLMAEDAGGLPVPRSHSSSGAESTPFRHGLEAQTSLGLADVLGFYRQELGKRGWKEKPGAAVEADAAQLGFETPDGPAVLKITRGGDATTVSLQVRDTAKAQKSGLLPKPGQVKALLGNMNDVEVAITIKGKTVKVPAGAGAKGPDGPTLELPPGKYTVQVKLAGQPATTETFDAGPDEIWGLIAGPGGVLPMQMY